MRNNTATEAVEGGMASRSDEIAPSISAQLASELERHRVELTGYAYRMLGSAFEAEDAVQHADGCSGRTPD